MPDNQKAKAKVIFQQIMGADFYCALPITSRGIQFVDVRRNQRLCQQDKEKR